MAGWLEQREGGGVGAAPHTLTVLNLERRTDGPYGEDAANRWRFQIWPCLGPPPFTAFCQSCFALSGGWGGNCHGAGWWCASRLLWWLCSAAMPCKI